MAEMAFDADGAGKYQLLESAPAPGGHDDVAPPSAGKVAAVHDGKHGNGMKAAAGAGPAAAVQAPVAAAAPAPRSLRVADVKSSAPAASDSPTSDGDGASTPQLSQRSTLSRCCANVSACLLHVSGCKDEEWFVRLDRPGASTTHASQDSGVRQGLFISEGDWAASRTWAFFPVAPRKATFDFVVMVCVVFTCFVIPYRLSFDDEVALTTDLFVQCIFILDLLLNFNTAFLHQVGGPPTEKSQGSDNGGGGEI